MFTALYDDAKKKKPNPSCSMAGNVGGCVSLCVTACVRAKNMGACKNRACVFASEECECVFACEKRACVFAFACLLACLQGACWHAKNVCARNERTC